jgi:hypothetical protein
MWGEITIHNYISQEKVGKTEPTPDIPTSGDLLWGVNHTQGPQCLVDDDTRTWHIVLLKRKL